MGDRENNIPVRGLFAAANPCLRLSTRTGWFIAVLLVIPSVVTAQQYQADDVDDKARLLSGVATGCVKDPTRYASDKERFTEYFTKFYFPAMTRFGPDELADLGKKRYDLFNLYLWKSQSQELQVDLTKIAYDAASRIVFSRDHNYHPAVRYNAILILGMLDEQYPAEGGGNRRPPKPLPDANTQLMKVVDAAVQGKRVPPSLLVGALIGLQRHAQYHESLNPNLIQPMTASMMKLALINQPPPDVDSQVFEWIKLQAATILANLGSVGPKSEVHTTLLKLLADSAMSLDSRCQVIALLGLVQYQGANVDATATADTVFQLAVDVGKAEAKRAKEFEDQHLTGGGYGGGRPGGGRGGYIDYGSQPEKFDRRMLLTRLGDLRDGLTKAKPLVPADRQPAIDAILAAMKLVFNAAQNEDTVTDLDLVDSVQKMAAAFETAAKPGASPATASVAKPVEDFSGN